MLCTYWQSFNLFLVLFAVQDQEAILYTQWERIIFGCESIDEVTRKGISIRGITEIVGASGSGKSQLCMQLALNVQMSRKEGGLERGAAYICTEGPFPSGRIHEMAEHRRNAQRNNYNWLDNVFVEHCFDSVSTLRTTIYHNRSGANVEANRAHCNRICIAFRQDQLLACVESRLPSLMRTKQIGLVVIDSVASVFRLGSDAVVRAAKMRNMVHQLQILSSTYECAVVCVVSHR